MLIKQVIKHCLIKATLFSVAFIACVGFVYASQDKSAKQYYWIDSDLRSEITSRIEMEYLPIRIQYQRKKGLHYWYLKEYGKEQLIDFVVTIKDDYIKQINVLEYREPYGGEIKNSKFLKQFQKARNKTTKNKLKLSNQVDGISGATISVNSITRVAKLALFLDAKINVKQ